MTAAEGLKLQKEFEQRRASLAPADSAADEQFLGSLVILARDASGNLRPPRPLTPAERELHREGRLANTIRGEILRADVAATRQQEATAKERGRAMMAATRAQSEARRLTDEVRRWQESSA
jgi:hypothetical protein